MTSNATCTSAVRQRAAHLRGLLDHAERAENAELWDVEGRRYIDFAGGIVPQPEGTPSPRSWPRPAPRPGASPPREPGRAARAYVALAERLNRAGARRLREAVFFTTGAEAIENAVKIAARAEAPGVIAFTGGCGRTLMTSA